MARNIQLPAPWVHLETIDGNQRDELERSLGANLKQSQLSENDLHNGLPISRNAWLFHGFRWVRVQNAENQTEALLRLQTLDGSNYIVSSVSFPLNQDKIELTGSDVRALPVASIAASYSHHEQAGSANLKTFLHILQEIEDDIDPLEPLPKADSTLKFAAVVARQYRHIEDNEPGAYVAKRMAEINDRPLATVQRWITKARKEGFLPPIATGRKPNA